MAAPTDSQGRGAATPGAGDEVVGSGRADQVRPTSPAQWFRLLPVVVVIGLCVPMWQATADWTTSVGGPGPAAYPRALIVLLVVAMLACGAQELRGLRRSATDEETGPEEGVEMDASLLRPGRVAVVMALSVGYVVATLYLGWPIATFVLVVVFLVLAGKRNPLTVLLLALFFSVGMAYVFVAVVYISLPTGVGVFDQLTVLLFELIGAY